MKSNLSIASRVALLAISTCLVFYSAACSGKSKGFPGAALVGPIGEVTIIPASGTAYRMQKDMEFKTPGLLLEGDAVRTGPASRVDLQFPTGLVMRLGADSAVKLTKGKILGGDNFGEVLMDLQQGRLMTRKKKLSSESRVLIRTPTITAAVRGTEFLVKQEGSEASVLVQEGTVRVHEGGLATRDGDPPPAPDAPDGPDAPDVPDVPEPPLPDDDDETATDVEEGNKIEVDDSETSTTTDEETTPDSENDVDVSELDEEDREELEEMSDGLDYMDAQGLQQIEMIMQSFEEAKAEIGEAVREQREKNRQMMDEERTRMKDEFEAQKDAIRGEGGVKGAQGDAKSEMDRIKNMQ